MKKTILLLSVLLAMIAWYPLLVITGWIQKFTVTVQCPLAAYFVLTLVFSLISLYLMCLKEKTVNAVTTILSGLLVPFSVANLFTWVWENRTFWFLLLALVWVVFSALLMYIYGKHAFFQGAMMGGSAVVLFLVVLLCLLLVFFSIGRITIVQTLPSPEGTYYAQVIDDNQGALGGNTLVEVYDTRKKIDLFFLSIQKDPQRVYWGRWGEFPNMKLEWESEQVLVINGRAYEVD